MLACDGNSSDTNIQAEMSDKHVWRGRTYTQLEQECLHNDSITVTVDNVIRPTLSQPIYEYLAIDGIPAKLVNIITMMYAKFAAHVICSNSVTDTFEIKTGVMQGCILSPFLFMLSMDWIMRTLESAGRRGIRSMLTIQLEDLDFADYICITSHRLSDMLSKYSCPIKHSKPA